MKSEIKNIVKGIIAEGLNNKRNKKRLFEYLDDENETVELVFRIKTFNPDLEENQDIEYNQITFEVRGAGNRYSHEVELYPKKDGSGLDVNRVIAVMRDHLEDSYASYTTSISRDYTETELEDRGVIVYTNWTQGVQTSIFIEGQYSDKLIQELYERM